MEFLIVLLVAVVVVGPYVVGFWAHIRAGRLERAVGGWLRAFEDLRVTSEAQAEEIAGLRRELAVLRGEPPAPDVSFAEIMQAAPEPAAVYEEAAVSPEMAAEPAGGATRGPRERLWGEGGLERQFGAVLPVWIGGIAIAFAGFFLVKYSIENDLVGPSMRVALGGLLGVALLIGARWVGTRAEAFGGHRIAQALAGAGIAVLYVSAYAATALYGLVPPLLGFAAMAATTAFAVILALRHGPPIALLGMVGGFLTPALITSGEPSAFLFFTYLYFIFAVLMFVIRRQGWWLLTFPTLLFAFGWVAAWIFSEQMKPGESVWMGLFLVAVAGTIVGASRQQYREETRELQGWHGLFSWRNRVLALNVVSIAGAMGLMAALAFNASFGLHDWVLFATLAVGAVALAFFDTPLYGFAPWAAMAINALMLAGWHPGSEREFIVALTAFGTLYVASGFLLVSSAAFPILWAGLSASAALGYFLLGYFRLPPAAPTPPAPVAIDVPPSTQPVEPLVEAVKQTAAAIPHVWGSLAMMLALLFFGAATWAARRLPTSLAKERVLAVYALACSAFVALAFLIELQREFVSVAIAAELLAVAWIATKTEIPSLRYIAGLLGLGFALLLLPQILLLLQLAAYSILAVQWELQATIPIVSHPNFQLALPAGMFLLAAYSLRRPGDSLLVRTLEYGAIALIALWGYYTTSRLFHSGDTVLFARATFLERGLITNVLFVYGLACLWIGRQFGRRGFFQSGLLLAAIAMFRIIYFDLLIKNPLWTHDAVAGTSPFDALTLTLLLPILWSWLAAQDLRRAESGYLMRFAKFIRPLVLIFAFAWISLEIRKLYQGPFLDDPATTDAEFYSYSAAWLLFGLGLLFYGTLKGSHVLRYASLALTLLTVTKVFLLDAGSLTGLYRVFSFLGLGVSLLGISYFYSRFVFGGDADGAPAASEASRESA